MKTWIICLWCVLCVMQCHAVCAAPSIRWSLDTTGCYSQTNLVPCSRLVLDVLALDESSVAGINVEFTGSTLIDQDGVRYSVDGDITLSLKLESSSSFYELMPKLISTPAIEKVTPTATCPSVTSLLSQGSFCCRNPTSGINEIRSLAADPAHPRTLILIPSVVYKSQNLTLQISSTNCAKSIELTYTGRPANSVINSADLGCGYSVDVSVPAQMAVRPPVDSYVAWECPSTTEPAPEDLESSIERLMSRAFVVPSKHLCSGINCIGIQPTSYVSRSDCTVPVGARVAVAGGSASDQFSKFRSAKLANLGLAGCNAVYAYDDDMMTSPVVTCRQPSDPSGSFYDPPRFVRFSCTDSAYVRMRAHFNSTLYLTSVARSVGVLDVLGATSAPLASGDTSAYVVIRLKEASGSAAVNASVTISNCWLSSSFAGDLRASGSRSAELSAAEHKAFVFTIASWSMTTVMTSSSYCTYIVRQDKAVIETGKIVLGSGTLENFLDLSDARTNKKRVVCPAGTVEVALGDSTYCASSCPCDMRMVFGVCRVPACASGKTFNMSSGCCVSVVRCGDDAILDPRTVTCVPIVPKESNFTAPNDGFTEGGQSTTPPVAPDCNGHGKPVLVNSRCKYTCTCDKGYELAFPEDRCSTSCVAIQKVPEESEANEDSPLSSVSTMAQTVVVTAASSGIYTFIIIYLVIKIISCVCRKKKSKKKSKKTKKSKKSRKTKKSHKKKTQKKTQKIDSLEMAEVSSEWSASASSVSSAGTGSGSRTIYRMSQNGVDSGAASVSQLQLSTRSADNVLTSSRTGALSPNAASPMATDRLVSQNADSPKSPPSRRILFSSSGASNLVDPSFSLSSPELNPRDDPLSDLFPDALAVGRPRTFSP